MQTMIKKGLLLALGLLFALIIRPQTDAILVTALLATISATSTAEWLAGKRLAWLPTIVFAIIATAIPVWCAFLPVIAYDAARMQLVSIPNKSSVLAQSSQTVDTALTSPTSATLVSNLLAYSVAHLNRIIPILRWVWIIPLIRELFMLRLNDISSITLIAFFVVLTFASFMWGFDARRATILQQQIRKMQDQTRESSRTIQIRLADIAEERAQSVRTATLRERTRIAREIHDNVGHLLTRAIMQTQAGRTVADVSGDTASAQAFGSLHETLHDAMTMIRRSVHDLEDNGTDFVAQIDDAVHALDNIDSKLSIHLTNDITVAPAPVTRCFATVIRESLTNVVRHSEAQQATVTLRDMPALWQLVVQDSGPRTQQRSDVQETASYDRSNPHSPWAVDEVQRGMGLADIESRTRALGGTSLCGPSGTGWRVFVSIPKAPWQSVTTPIPASISTSIPASMLNTASTSTTTRK